jgi:hypothetical protein
MAGMIVLCVFLLCGVMLVTQGMSADVIHDFANVSCGEKTGCIKQVSIVIMNILISYLITFI